MAVHRHGTTQTRLHSSPMQTHRHSNRNLKARHTVQSAAKVFTSKASDPMAIASKSTNKRSTYPAHLSQQPVSLKGNKYRLAYHKANNYHFPASLLSSRSACPVCLHHNKRRKLVV